MRGLVREVVIYFKFHENRSRGLGAVGVENCPLPLTRPMAYTTACTTVQAVIWSNVTLSRIYLILCGVEKCTVGREKVWKSKDQVVSYCVFI